MGLGKHLIRAIRSLISDFAGIFKRKKKSPRSSEPELVKVPRSWRKEDSEPKADKVKIIEQQKMRIPGFRQFKRMLAAFLLLLNFMFSQFLLGSLGSQAQPLFFIFLANSFILGDYLWKTRKQK